MRIIAGKYRGHRLVSFNAKHIRPTTDRVKESIFNKLQFRLEGANVLDLYAGTGNLGFECLSRGAASVTAVESHPQSVRIIKENLALLKIEKDSYSLLQKDVIRYLKSDLVKDPKFDVILIDPPFTKSLAHETMLDLGHSGLWHSEIFVMIESSQKELIEDHYPPFQLLERKEYGDKKVSFFH